MSQHAVANAVRVEARHFSLQLADGGSLDVGQAGPRPTACSRLADERGHLSLVVDSFRRILDELLGVGG